MIVSSERSSFTTQTRQYRKKRESYHGSTLSKLDTDASKGLKPQTIHITLGLLICAQGTSLALVTQDVYQ